MSELFDATRKGDLQRVKRLVEKGVDVNSRSIGGWTPLHYAASSGCLEVAQLLVEKGADVNARVGDDWTPLHYAAYHGHFDVARFLLEAGANPTLRDNSGRTPADLAREQGYEDIAELLEDWVERASLIISVEVGSLVKGKWGVLRVKLNRKSTLLVEGDVDWMDPGVVQGVVEVPVKARRAGRVPVGIVARSGRREERKVIWVEVAEGRLASASPVYSFTADKPVTLAAGWRGPTRAEEGTRVVTEEREHLRRLEELERFKEYLLKLEEEWRRGAIPAYVYETLKKEYLAKIEQLENELKNQHR